MLANDRIAPDVGETLTVIAVGATDQGGSVVTEGSAVRYTPAAGFAGNENFSYTIDDGKGATHSASVAVSVVPAPQNPPQLFLPSLHR